MAKKQLILEEKKLYIDRTIIGIITIAVFVFYVMFIKQKMGYIININIVSRLLLNALI